MAMIGELVDILRGIKKKNVLSPLAKSYYLKKSEFLNRIP